MHGMHRSDCGRQGLPSIVGLCPGPVGLPSFVTLTLPPDPWWAICVRIFAFWSSLLVIRMLSDNLLKAYTPQARTASTTSLTAPDTGGLIFQSTHLTVLKLKRFSFLWDSITLLKRLLETPQTEWLKQRTYLSYHSVGWKSKTKVLAGLAPSEASLLGW